MARIAWVEDAQASGLLAELYDRARSTRNGRMPDIYRTMSLRPDFLQAIMNAAESLHFQDGALTRAQHEMVASYVSALNKCHYWLSAHAWLLQEQGEDFAAVAEALREGDLDKAPVTPAERKLLELVGTLTQHAYRITDEQVQELRDVGWSDEQIAEAVYVGALFNLFVRLADTFDIHPPNFMDGGVVPVAARKDTAGTS